MKGAGKAPSPEIAVWTEYLPDNSRNLYAYEALLPLPRCIGRTSVFSGNLSLRRRRVLVFSVRCEFCRIRCFRFCGVQMCLWGPLVMVPSPPLSSFTTSFGSRIPRLLGRIPGPYGVYHCGSGRGDVGSISDFMHQKNGWPLFSTDSPYLPP